MRGGFQRRLYQGRRHQRQLLRQYRNAAALFGIVVGALALILVASLSVSPGRNNVALPRIPRPTPATAPSSPDISDVSPVPAENGPLTTSVPAQQPLPHDAQTTSPAGPPARSPVRSPVKPAASPNLAAGRPTIETSHTDVYVATNAVDGNANTYWESANHAFPQSFTVDLGYATSVSRIVLRLPPLPTWLTRTQTLSVLGSTDGSGYSTIVGTANYTFNPATGNTASIGFTTTSQRYLRLAITANTDWPAAQISEFEVYAS